MKTNRLYILFFILFALDILVLFFAYEISLKMIASFNWNYANFEEDSVHRYMWVHSLLLVFLVYEGIYFQRFDFWRETKQIIKALFFSLVTVFVILSLTNISYEYSSLFLVTYFLVLLFLLPFSKRVVKKILFSINFFRLGCNVIGKENFTKPFLQEFKHNWYLGLNVLESKQDIAFVISNGFTPKELNKLIEQKLLDTKNLYVVPYLYQFDFSHTKNIDYFNLRLSAFHLQNRLLSKKSLMIKSFFERMVVLFLLPAVFTVHFLISLIIKSSSSGPVFFKQKRIGKDGRLFSCYKYRTMYEDQDFILRDYLQKNPNEQEYYKTYHKYKNDPRITKVGAFLRKSSLDELPQFFNVLRGDMSLIGPRPYMPVEEDAIHAKHKEIIIKVKPGITGLWQVSGRNNLTFDQRVDMDVWYIQNWSLWMDFVIFMKTIKVVFGKVGAR